MMISPPSGELFHNFTIPKKRIFIFKKHPVMNSKIISQKTTIQGNAIFYTIV